MPPSQYAATLKTAMSEAYERVRVNTARKLQHQSTLYNKKVHGSPYNVGGLGVGSVSPDTSGKIEETIPTMEWTFCGG